MVAHYAFDLRRKGGLLAKEEIVARHPLYLAPPLDVAVPADGDWPREGVLLLAIERALHGFMNGTAPSSAGSFVFEVTVYAAAGIASLPVLRVANLQLPLTTDF